MAEIEMGNLYSMNKTLVEKYEKPLINTDLTNKITENFIPYLSKMILENNYFMLLCNEKKDYTVFSIETLDKDSAIEDTAYMLEQCLKNRGVTYGIDVTEDQYAIEIWIRTEDDEEMHCYYFFPYDSAIIHI